LFGNGTVEFGEVPRVNVQEKSLFWFHALQWFFWLIGGVTLLAFAASVMPQKWIVEASEFLGFKPFPESPLTYYLARNLSLLYGFVGVLMLFVVRDLYRYRDLVRFLAIATIAFGASQLIVDLQSEMPLWWALGESLSTLAGGCFFFWLQSKVVWIAEEGS